MWGLAIVPKKGWRQWGSKRRWRSQRWISDWHAGCNGVTLERTIRELRGEACFALEEGTGAKQQLVVSVRLDRGSRNWRRCSRR